MNKKKIFFVASIPNHIKAFHLPYLQWFKDNGYETHIATNGPLESPCIDKFHIVNFSRSIYSKDNFKAFFQLKKIVEREQYDLINCHTPIAGAITRMASYRARKNGTKIIYTAHGFHFYDGAPFRNWLFFYPIERLLTRYTDALITINTEDYRRIKRIGSSRCKYFLINGIGVDSDKFFPKKRGAKELFSTKKNIVLTYVARLEKEKGHHFLIDSIIRNKDTFEGIKIQFVGDGYFSDELKQKVSHNGLGNIVSFLGFREDIPDIFRDSDFVLSASEREGLPINIVEGLLTGLPAIATINRGHLELIDNECDGFLFSINDEKMFIEIIRKVKSKKYNYEKLSENALQKAVKFSLNSSLDKITKIYQEILGIK